MFVCFRIGSPNFLLNRCMGIATFTFVSQRYVLQCTVALQYYVKQFPIKIPSLHLMFSRDSSGISVRLSRKFVATIKKGSKIYHPTTSRVFSWKIVRFFHWWIPILLDNYTQIPWSFYFSSCHTLFLNKPAFRIFLQSLPSFLWLVYKIHDTFFNWSK